MAATGNSCFWLADFLKSSPLKPLALGCHRFYYLAPLPVLDPILKKLTDDGRQTMDAKWWQKLTLPLARWAKNKGTKWQGGERDSRQNPDSITSYYTNGVCNSPTDLSFST
jgi:hypothetical protein